MTSWPSSVTGGFLSGRETACDEIFQGKAGMQIDMENVIILVYTDCTVPQVCRGHFLQFGTIPVHA